MCGLGGEILDILDRLVSDSETALWQDCDRLMTFTTIFSGLGITLSESELSPLLNTDSELLRDNVLSTTSTYVVILTVRTYALYSSSKKILIFFVMAIFTLGAINIWAMAKWTGSFNAHIKTIPTELDTSVRCYLSRASNIGLLCYFSLLTGETIIVLMTALKATSAWWESRGLKSSRLITAFYRDGTVAVVQAITLQTI
ncbi:hypothetical protein E1B28_006788 [Marasmius oreades]|uniref:Uncharacterized protein n=1 Tax=Marasmius oreades TaxID=181124 RepID=A0A9P7UWV6_9AGAR|nr:uncharacterized protein E1B28_006788 [Marasmius oreades]KAG7096114.1 hypothetical protein E1B28_006788 [Marasmius oreades]